jgi:SAM-dependent methyltransferase
MFMKNIDLVSKYDDIYSSGAYDNYFTYNQHAAERLIVDAIPDWNGLKVLDIGCGEGNLVAMISFAGASKVDGVDFSIEAIKLAQSRIAINNVNFISSDYKEISEKYDVVVMNGVLEHFDNPWDELDYIRSNLLTDNGYVITTSPSFLNPRGYVWMTLQVLLDVPMSLSDLHSLCPFDVIEYCQQRNCSLAYDSCDQDWGAGPRTIIDFRKRLTNALKDANLNNQKVDTFLTWMDKAVPFFNTDESTGATVGYKIGR